MSDGVRRIPAARCVLAATLALALALGACSVSTNDAGYVSFWRVRHPEPPALPPAEGTLRGDFERAASAVNREAARERWRAFLDAHGPSDDGYEDAMQIRLVAWARAELERIEALGSGDAGALRRAEAALAALAE